LARLEAERRKRREAILAKYQQEQAMDQSKMADSAPAISESTVRASDVAEVSVRCLYVNFTCALCNRYF
jgi:hypothetical protein